MKGERFKFGNQFISCMKGLLWILAAVLLISCKSKKTILPGDEPEQVEDFIDLFAPASLPFEISDSAINRKEKDSLLMKYNIFVRFIPDSVFSRVFGKKSQPKIYPLKKVEVDDQETYLFVKAVLGGKKVGYIFGFDKEKNFAGYMELLRLDASSATKQVSGVDKNLTVYKNVSRKKPDGSTDDGKEVYVFNQDARQFTLIMTDALDEQLKEVLNPIDTFSKKNKFSADYVKDKMNIVSVRDSNRPGRINFFIHFEKNRGECRGEIKGEAAFVSSNTAVYRLGGDPCVLQLRFSTSSVTIKELKACGNRRGVKCSFDGIFPKKKTVRPRITQKKK